MKASAVCARATDAPGQGEAWAQRGKLGPLRGLESPILLWPSGPSPRESLGHVYARGAPRLAHEARDSVVTLRPRSGRHQSEAPGPESKLPGQKSQRLPPKCPGAAGLDRSFCPPFSPAVLAHLKLCRLDSPKFSISGPSPPAALSLFACSLKKHTR